jgi:hypothetical protein
MAVAHVSLWIRIIEQRWGLIVLDGGDVVPYFTMGKEIRGRLNNRSPEY